MPCAKSLLRHVQNCTAYKLALRFAERCRDNHILLIVKVSEGSSVISSFSSSLRILYYWTLVTFPGKLLVEENRAVCGCSLLCTMYY